MNGTTIVATFAIRLRPPMMTKATHSVTQSPVIAVAYEMEESPKRKSSADGMTVFTADVMPFTCVIVPMPRSPASVPNIAKRTASHLKFRPKRSLIPCSM